MAGLRTSLLHAENDSTAAIIVRDVITNTHKLDLFIFISFPRHFNTHSDQLFLLIFPERSFRQYSHPYPSKQI